MHRSQSTERLSTVFHHPCRRVLPRDSPVTTMKISVMGLGYVGTASAACLAQEGHEVIGVDTERLKVDLVNAGRPPVLEQHLGGTLARQVAARSLSVTTDLAGAVQHTDRPINSLAPARLRNGRI